MITLPAHKVRQFGVEFYQTSFTSGYIQKLVKFEVLNYASPEEGPKSRKSVKTSPVNWGLLEKRIGQSEAAFQRPMIRKKIRELVQYYAECQEAQNLHVWHKSTDVGECQVVGDGAPDRDFPADVDEDPNRPEYKVWVFPDGVIHLFANTVFGGFHLWKFLHANTNGQKE